MKEDNTCYLDRSSVRLLALGRDDADLLKAIDALQIFTKADFNPPLPDSEAVAWREANRSDAEEFCKGAFGPFGVELEPYVRIVAELLNHACERLASPPSESGDVRAALEPILEAMAGVPHDSYHDAAPFARVPNDARAKGTVRTISWGQMRALVRALTHELPDASNPGNQRAVRDGGASE